MNQEALNPKQKNLERQRKTQGLNTDHIPNAETTEASEVEHGDIVLHDKYGKVRAYEVYSIGEKVFSAVEITDDEEVHKLITNDYEHDTPEVKKTSKEILGIEKYLSFAGKLVEGGHL